MLVLRGLQKEREGEEFGVILSLRHTTGAYMALEFGLREGLGVARRRRDWCTFFWKIILQGNMAHTFILLLKTYHIKCKQS